MFDVGNLPVLTFGNYVMCINGRADQVVFESTHVRFLTFFKIQKHDFLRLFEFLHRFSVNTGRKRRVVRTWWLWCSPWRRPRAARRLQSWGEAVPSSILRWATDWHLSASSPPLLCVPPPHLCLPHIFNSFHVPFNATHASFGPTTACFAGEKRYDAENIKIIDKSIERL